MDRVTDIKCVPKLQIDLFDHLQIYSDHAFLDEDMLRSNMLTKLIVYMLSHKESRLSVQELSEALWENEECGNPVGALKNLMYRLRTVLKQKFGEQDYILTGIGSYKWNEEIEISLDTDEFECLCHKAEGEHDINKRLVYEREAEALYKNRFQCQYTDQYWVMSLSVYYHSLYLSMVKQLGRDLEEVGGYAELEEKMQSAIEKDCMEEELHYILIKALIYQNKIHLALESYQKITTKLYDTMGVEPSEKLKELYTQMMKQMHQRQTNISIIVQNLEEENETRAGAYYCEYWIFKKNYQLELRRAERQHRSIFIGLINITPSLPVSMDSQIYKEISSHGMKQIKSILLANLRQGDMISRFSGTQFIVMLPECNYMGARKVLDRVIEQFNRQKQHAKVTINYSLDEITQNRLSGA